MNFPLLWPISSCVNQPCYCHIVNNYSIFSEVINMRRCNRLCVPQTVNCANIDARRKTGGNRQGGGESWRSSLPEVWEELASRRLRALYCQRSEGNLLPVVKKNLAAWDLMKTWCQSWPVGNSYLYYSRLTISGRCIASLTICLLKLIVIHPRLLNVVLTLTSMVLRERRAGFS